MVTILGRASRFVRRTAALPRLPSRGSVAAAALAALLASAPGAAHAKKARPAAGAAAEPRATGPQVTFSGFVVLPSGTSRLYVHLTEDVPVLEQLSGKKAEYVLSGARVPLRNNKNALITRHFLTQVVSVHLVADGHKKGKKARHAESGPTEVRLVVEMREAVKPQHRMQKNADGTTTLVIDFPKPSKPPAPEQDETPPAPKAEGDAAK